MAAATENPARSTPEAGRNPWHPSPSSRARAIGAGEALRVGAHRLWGPWDRRIRPSLGKANLWAGAILVGLTAFAALLSLVWTPADPAAVQIAQRHQPPSLAHLLGTDEFGRDLLSRVMVGARSALLVGVIAVSISVLVGVTVGAISGYYGGRLDEWLMRVVDGFYAFPDILLALMVVTAFGPGLTRAAIAIGIAGFPVFARLTRGSFLSLREREFVEAARAIGQSDWRIIWRHILPNAMGPLIVQATVSFAAALLAEAGLSYLGLGTQPPDPSWGRMLKESQRYLGRSLWPAVVPGAAIALTVLGLGLLGDGLRDRLDPRRR